jgi:energy-coupling factor transport system permease protein
MNNLVLGKYIPIDSPIHRLDPRAKLLALLGMLIAVFIPASWYGYGLLAIILLIVLKMAKIKLSFILKSFKPMMFMMIFLLVINIISNKEGYVLLQLPFITIYSEAIFNTLYIVVRLILMIMVTTLLTATTKPLEMTLGIEYLLKPFGRIGLPYHEVAMMISIALRFIPTIIDEATRIMNAQKSRGVDFDEGKLKEKIGAIVSLIVPLFSSAFIRADELALAMEARAYVPSAPRTRYKQLRYQGRDYVLLLAVVLIIAALILIAIYL